MLLAAIDDAAEARMVKGSGRGAVTALTLSADGRRLFVGEASGRMLWLPLDAS